MLLTLGAAKAESAYLRLRTLAQVYRTLVEGRSSSVVYLDDLRQDEQIIGFSPFATGDTACPGPDLSIWTAADDRCNIARTCGPSI